MNTTVKLFAAALLLASAGSALADVHYVDVNSTNATPPYICWSTAATNIQDAVDAAVAGDEIVVTDGTYATGGRAGFAVTVIVDKAVNIQSVSGPQFTVIEGGHSNGCVYLTDNASLSGFTLTQGIAWGGGGVSCESRTAAVSNCVIVGNSASRFGGGAYGGTLNNCTLSGNSAQDGGGAALCTLDQCTLTDNSATDGGGGTYSCHLNSCTVVRNQSGGHAGGASDSSLNNSILYFNTAPQGANYVELGSTLNYCCTSPRPSEGIRNITNAPLFIDLDGGNLRLRPDSLCINAGGNTSVTASSDLDGNSRISGGTVDLGVYEFQNPPLNGPLSVAIAASFTNVATGFALEFTGLVEGRTTVSAWDFGDGTAITNQPLGSHAWTAPGDYAVFLRAYNDDYPGGISATVGVHVVTQAIYYVAAGSTNPVAPYISWNTAATNIQDAVEAATVVGALVLVTNGTYCPVTVGKSLTLRSLNGPGVTIIDGGQSNRCVYLTNSASLSGFTVTNGRAPAGGGLFCESTTAVVSNCVVSGNSSFVQYGFLFNPPCCERFNYGPSGGGAYGGTLNNCILKYNLAETVTSVGPHCSYCFPVYSNPGLYVGYPIPGLGGGACNAILNHCTLTSNSAGYGGGAYGCTLNNCTLGFNSASGGRALVDFDCGGGAYGCTANNCIIYFNTAPYGGPNYDSSSTLNYSCTTPMPTNGVGNISEDPQLASASYLSATSPCRGAGNAAFASGTDIDGEPWASPPSIGCDEYHVGGLTGPLTVAITASFQNVVVGFASQLWALIEGRPTASSWDFGDGTVVTNLPYASHAWVVPGDYPVVLRAFNESHPGGISATVTVHVASETLYVAANNTNPVPPYASWATAATNIQDAVDAAPEMGKVVVVVSNGVYASGSRATYNGDNRVVIEKWLTVRSVNGAEFTIIDGGHSNRCVFLTDGATLSGFTLTNGAAEYGAGASRGILNNCTLVGNSASQGGGGAASSVLNNCCVSGNSAWRGGGALGGTLNNCTLAGNLASDSGGGVFNATLNDCIVYFNINTAGQGTNDNYAFGTLNYCCTTPLATYGVGNITNAPLFLDTNGWSNLRLQSNSPCINAGNNAFAPAGLDLDGHPRIVSGSVDMGAYEYQFDSTGGIITLANMAKLPGGEFEFTFIGAPNGTYTVLMKADVRVPWTVLGPASELAPGLFAFREQQATNNSQRFYAVVNELWPIETRACPGAGPNPCPCNPELNRCIISLNGTAIWQQNATGLCPCAGSSDF